VKHEYAGADDRIHRIRPAKMYDNHGRRFAATLDKSNATPIGQGPRPDGWSAPWMPGQEWFRYHEDDEHPNRFRIDYEGMLADRIKAHDDYDQAFMAEAVKRGWDAKDPDKAGQITAIIGKRPLPIELIVAAMQGNKYVLGLTTKVDSRITPFLNQKPIYRREARKQAVLASMDFADHDEDEAFEERMDLQEKYQPDAEPMAPRPVRRKKAPSVPEAA
jgi:hypothetical protein